MNADGAERGHRVEEVQAAGARGRRCRARRPVPDRRRSSFCAALIAAHRRAGRAPRARAVPACVHQELHREVVDAPRLVGTLRRLGLHPALRQRWRRATCETACIRSSGSRPRGQRPPSRSCSSVSAAGSRGSGRRALFGFPLWQSFGVLKSKAAVVSHWPGGVFRIGDCKFAPAPRHRIRVELGCGLASRHATMKSDPAGDTHDPRRTGPQSGPAQARRRAAGASRRTRRSRLKSLTDLAARWSAVYFGGKFRIVDFALSNCMNSASGASA